jgi:FkbM family methyltransferase
MKLKFKLRRLTNALNKSVAREARRKHVPVNYYRFFRRMREEFGIRTVLDVGANVGDFSRWCAESFPQADIHAFEPLPTCLEKLNLVAERYHRIKVHPVALGPDVGTVEMFENEFSPSSSLLPMLDRHKEIWPKTAKEQKIKVNQAALDEMETGLELVPPIFMKVDVQGYEIQVLRGSEKTLSDIAVIMLEVMFESLYAGQSNFHAIVNYMAERNFHFMEFVDERRDSESGRLIYADAAFFNRRFATKNLA